MIDFIVFIALDLAPERYFFAQFLFSAYEHLFYLNWPGGAPKIPCLLAALDGEKPRIFWTFWRIDIVHKM